VKDTSVALLRNRPFFGSRITSLPALYYLKTKHPNHKLLLIGRNSDANFYSQLDWVDQVEDSKNLLSDIIKIPLKPKIMVSFQPSSERAAIIKILKKPKLSAGYFKKRNILSNVWDKRIKFRKDTYRATHYLELIQLFETQRIDLSETLAAPFQALAAAAKKSSRNEGHYFNILIMPGGGAGDFKKWGKENFICVARQLAENIKKPAYFHVALGPDEEKEKVYFSNINDERVIVHYCLDLPDLCRTISEASIVIANDCGPSHIAQCLGKPFVGIYSHNNTEWFRQNQNSVMVKPHSDQSIKDINIDTILQASLSVLDSGITYKG